MIILSRYTHNGAFPQLAQRLKDSCDKHGLFYDIKPTDDLGSWERMCNAKPRWILKTLLNYRQGVLWIDADCEIMSPPTLLFHCAEDFAVYNFAADADNRCSIAFDPNKLVCSGGVLLFTYTAAALELLVRWISKINETPYTHGTDNLLDAAYNDCRPPVKPLWLPKSYNRLDSRWPDVVPVINHLYREGKLRDTQSGGAKQ